MNSDLYAFIRIMFQEMNSIDLNKMALLGVNGIVHVFQRPGHARSESIKEVIKCKLEACTVNCLHACIWGFSRGDSFESLCMRTKCM